MKLTKCKRHHFYDADKYESCPHCPPQPADETAQALGGSTGSLENDEQATVPVWESSMDQSQEGFGEIDNQQKTVDMNFYSAEDMIKEAQTNSQQSSLGEQPTMAASLLEAVEKAKSPRENSRVNEDLDDCKTVSLYQAKTGIEPVAGWLVCIEGPSFGASYTLKTGRNFIGRGSDMDVVLAQDNSVSRQKHAILLYEPKKREFIAQPGDSRELFYLNEDVVLGPERLKAQDILTIGNSRLMFFPCCGENFSWDDYKKENKAGE